MRQRLVLDQMEGLVVQVEVAAAKAETRIEQESDL
jgi:hypothetical protein